MAAIEKHEIFSADEKQMSNMEEKSQQLFTETNQLRFLWKYSFIIYDRINSFILLDTVVLRVRFDAYGERVFRYLWMASFADGHVSRSIISVISIFNYWINDFWL